MWKKALCLIFAFLLSINSFAAVVSDNDGSAFITKAEFDSLKNDFQSQLDSYNTNIDNKIDDAIASYLAGIDIKAKRELPSILNNAGQKFISSNSCGFVSTSKGTYRRYFINIGVCTGGAASDGNYLTQLQYLTGGINAPDWKTQNSRNYGVFYYGTRPNSGEYYVKKYMKAYPYAAVAGVMTDGRNEGTTTTFTIPNKTFTSSNADAFGAGNDTWEINVGKAYTVNVVKTYGVEDVFTSIEQDYLTGYALADATQYFVSEDDINKPGSQYWDCNNDACGYEIQRAGKGWTTPTNNNTKLRVYNHYYYSMNRLEILNEKLTGIMNENVYYYNGCPIFKTDDKDGKIKLKLHIVNSGNYPTVFQIKKDKFDNSTIPENGKTSDYKWNEVIKVDSTATGVDVSLDFDVKKKEVYWIKARPLYTPSGTVTEFTYPSIITTTKIEFEEER